MTGTAAAEPNIPGTFIIASPVAPAGNRTIGYTVGGSATPGTDYTALPGSVVLASGNYSVTVTLNVKDDDELEGNETVMLTLQPGSGYSSGSRSPALQLPSSITTHIHTIFLAYSVALKDKPVGDICPDRFLYNKNTIFRIKKAS